MKTLPVVEKCGGQIKHQRRFASPELVGGITPSKTQWQMGIMFNPNNYSRYHYVVSWLRSEVCTMAIPSKQKRARLISKPY
jgi:hypothetical protein